MVQRKSKETTILSLLEMALKCRAAPAAVHATVQAVVHAVVNAVVTRVHDAVHGTVIRVSVALHYQSGDVAAHFPDPITAKLVHVHAAETAAFYHHVRVHVPIALV